MHTPARDRLLSPLTALLIVVWLLAVAATAPVPARATPTAAGGVVRRSATTNTYPLGGGRFRATVAATAVNYADANAAWQPIDTTMRVSARAGYRYANTTNGLRSFFAASSASADAVRVEAGDAWLSWQTAELLGSGVATRASASADRMSAVGATLRYAGGLPGVVERYAVLANGLKHDVVLTARPAGLQGAIFAHRSLLRLSPGLRLFANNREQRGAFATTGAIELRDATGAVRMRIEPPVAYEQADIAHERAIALTYRVAGVGATRSLSLEASADWLNDAARVYPVVLDPTTTVEIGDNDSAGLDMVIADNPNDIGGQTGETSTTRGFNLVKRDITRSGMFTPTQAQRSLLKFALDPQIFNNSSVSVTHINTATFQLSFAQYVNNSNCSSVPTENLTQTVDLYRLTRDWDGNAGWNTPWATPGGDVAAPALDGRDVPLTSGQGSIFAWNATAAVQGWVAGSFPNDGLLLKLRDELAYDKCGIAFYSSNAGDANGTPVGHPQLLIDYTASPKGVDVQIIPPPKQYADPGGTIQYIARVTPNSVTNGTVDLVATSSVPSWTIGGLPGSVAVSAGQSTDVPFSVTVPTSGAAPGDTQITRVTATLSGAQQVSDFAEVQSQVRLDTPDIRLLMRRAPTYIVAPGDLVTYTLVYSSYFREVSSAVLTDTLPDSSLVDLVSCSTGGVTSTVGTRIRIAWPPENVNELTPVTKQVVVRVKPTAPFYVRFDNSAGVAGTPADRPEYARDNSVTTVTATGKKLYLPIVGVPESLFVP